MDIKDAELGRKVVYTPFEGCSPSQLEEGVITSWNDTYIFVRYHNDFQSKATDPADLEYISKL